MFNIHDASALERFRSAQRIEPRILRAVRNEFLKRGRSAGEAAGRLAASGVPTGSLDSIEWHSLERIERRDSAVDGATKLLLATRGGERIESVILRYATGRTSLCISSQVGCAAACAFCATGRMGLVRSLDAPEILDQVVLANELLAGEARRVRNVVFMGMGEPFHNETAVCEAIDALTSPALFDYSPQRVLVSTVGVPDAMVRFATRFPKTNLALSLHAATQETRERLVPLARKASLERLRSTVAEVNTIQGRPVMIEYVLLDGINDGPDDLDALAAWLECLVVHVNLIPWNPIEGAELVPTGRAAREAFGAELKRRGFKVTLRYSQGGDIEAACGQLVRDERRTDRRRAGAPR